jgi:anti-sigma regulatory factor (Ser/Thr protein kinase)
MPSSEYYRAQAKVLLMLMLAMRDSQRAKKVEAKAREFLAQAQLPHRDIHELNAVLEEFNNSQLRKGQARDG